MTEKADNLPSDETFFEQHPEVDVLEAFIIEVNGMPRGKWIPADTAQKIFKDGLRLPRSVCAVDVWGEDVLPVGLVTETGDSDGICKAVPGTLKLVPWREKPAAQVLMTMHNADGTPFYGDPRHVLQSVLNKCRDEGFNPVVAMELEFYLFSPDHENKGYPRPPVSDKTGRRHDSAQVYSLTEMEAFEAILSGITDACAQQGIPADTTISENGPGQFEVNLKHVDDAMQAADHAVLIKRVIRSVAQQHGLDATFMAKPYAEDAGNGLHIHLSLSDEDGNNVFMGETSKGSDLLLYAVGGLLDTMPEGMAVFASNANSYRRFQEGSHAPTKLTWGYDNRAASIRIPAGDLKATRIEHRVSGADANPYLVLALILAGILYGIDDKTDPGAPAEGDAYSTDAAKLPSRWNEALHIFEGSAFIERYLGEDYKKLYAACKRQEKQKLETLISDIEYDAYLRSI